MFGIPTYVEYRMRGIVVKYIKSVLLVLLICLVLSSCKASDDYKTLSYEYLTSVGLEGFVLPGKEYVVSKDYVHVYSNCTYEDFRYHMDSVINYVSELKYTVYCTNPSYDEQRGPFLLFDKYLFVPTANEDFFVSKDIRFELFYEYNDELYMVNSSFENESITIEIISTKQMYNVTYRVYES